MMPGLGVAGLLVGAVVLVAGLAWLAVVTQIDDDRDDLMDLADTVRED